MASVKGEFDIDTVRNHFPAVKIHTQVFLDNAGGSQVLGEVIDSITEYLHETNVQIYASYPVSQQSTSKYNQGLHAAAEFLNAELSEIVIGPSTTQLFSNLSSSLALTFPPDSEFVLSSIDHEANIAPWVRLAQARNFAVKWWTPSRSELKLTPENLRPLLSEKTKLVACTHASNLIGTIHDIKAIAEEVHTVSGAMLCVDGVAYAPHREVDVKELGVDFYAFSWYKVYGPHIAVLYGSNLAQSWMASLGHYFHAPADTLAIKLGLAAASYELVAAIPSVLSYFGSDRKKTWKAIAAHEGKLQQILLEYLNNRKDIVIYGETSADAKLRVPVVSFSVNGKSSQDIVEKVEACSNYGIRNGHFYSKRAVDNLLGLKADGVIRVSMVHYNTGLVMVLDKVLA
ncbi:MAG: hypothetical protein LQ351_005532 [Letrouitia transgressa]|nr:MAG: hypothetical protein LQ351_005532 [Letrouitia transgressa]